MLLMRLSLFNLLWQSFIHMPAISRWRRVYGHDAMLMRQLLLWIFVKKHQCSLIETCTLTLSGNAIDSLSRSGHLAVGVPGTVDAMFKIFEKYSKLKDFEKLISPSIELADKWFSKSPKNKQIDSMNKALSLKNIIHRNCSISK